MTKWPHSASRLRLSRFIHWLAVLCFIKLTILGALLLDVPVPMEPAPEKAQRELPAQAQTDAATTTQQAADGAVASSADENVPAVARSGFNDPSLAPQGAEAARLAAAAKPRDAVTAPLVDASLPAPLVPAGVSQAPRGGAAPKVLAQHIPAPQPLPAPQAQAGAPVPAGKLLLASAAPRRADAANGLLDFLDLKRLPIPGLGSTQTAHAAALDMPVPQTPPMGAGQSAFAPPEQNVAPGPRTGSGGTPLPPRGAVPEAMPPLPQNNGGKPSGSLPVPSVDRSGAAAGNANNLKAQELARQQQDILMLRRQMDQRIKDLQNTEKKMQDMIREARGLENEKVKRLILTYSNMKPKAAAKALESMDERVAVRILSGMTPKQAGEIMTYMEPVRTAKLTELITRMRIPD